MIDDQSPKIKPTRRRGPPRSNPAQRPSSTGPVNGHPDRDLSETERGELERLRKDIAVLRMERDFANYVDVRVMPMLR